jgi:hypothetical protein
MQPSGGPRQFADFAISATAARSGFPAALHDTHESYDAYGYHCDEQREKYCASRLKLDLVAGNMEAHSANPRVLCTRFTWIVERQAAFAVPDR